MVVTVVVTHPGGGNSMAKSKELTVSGVKALKPAGKPYRVADGGGLYLLVGSNGSKSWQFRYRWQGKAQTLSLGVYGDTPCTVSLAKARAKAQKARVALTDGANPGARDEETKESTSTFDAVARLWFETIGKNISADHLAKQRRRYELYLKPDLGDMDVTDITRADVLKALQRIADRGKIETVHRVLRIAAGIIRRAMTERHIAVDVTIDLSKEFTQPEERHHSAPADDPAKIGEILLALDCYTGSPVVGAALRLLPYLFCRPGELRGMRWDQLTLDSDTPEWRYTLSKTKQPHVVPLPRQALEILREIQPLTSNTEHVFAGPSYTGRPISNMTMLTALVRLGISKDTLTPHGWRAVARTQLDEVLRYRPDFIEHQLGHRVKDSLGRAYNRTSFIEDRREMMQADADYLDGLKAKASGRGALA